MPEEPSTPISQGVVQTLLTQLAAMLRELGQQTGQLGAIATRVDTVSIDVKDSRHTLQTVEQVVFSDRERIAALEAADKQLKQVDEKLGERLAMIERERSEERGAAKLRAWLSRIIAAALTLSAGLLGAWWGKS